MGLAYDEDSKILYANDGESLYTLNVSNGAATLLGSNNTQEVIGAALHGWMVVCNHYLHVTSQHYLNEV